MFVEGSGYSESSGLFMERGRGGPAKSVRRRQSWRRRHCSSSAFTSCRITLRSGGRCRGSDRSIRAASRGSIESGSPYNSYLGNTLKAERRWKRAYRRREQRSICRTAM